MERRGPRVSFDEVSTFEDTFGYSLPDDYRGFLLDVNGGRTEASHCEFEGGVLNRLFSLNDPDESRDLLVRAERARRDLPAKELLFVAHDDGGARILVVLDGRHRGEVWLQTTTDVRPADANPRVLWHDRRDMRKLASSFAAFMAALKPLQA